MILTWHWVTEADVFGRLIDASNPTLTPEAAAGILQLGYSEADHARMDEPDSWYAVARESGANTAGTNMG